MSSHSISALPASRRRGFFVCRWALARRLFLFPPSPLRRLRRTGRFSARRVLRGVMNNPKERSQRWQKRTKEKKQKKRKEGKEKTRRGVIHKPSWQYRARTRGRTRAKAASALHMQLRGGGGGVGGDRRQLLPALHKGHCAVGVVLPPFRPSADHQQGVLLCLLPQVGRSARWRVRVPGMAPQGVRQKAGGGKRHGKPNTLRVYKL